MTTFQSALARCPIIPVVTLERVEDALPLAEALLEGGIATIEITLRSEAGLPAIAALAKANTGICVGAGTIATPQQLHEVAQAGAAFAISPFCDEALLAQASKEALTYLPGVVTPSEIAQARAGGCSIQKFFPAAAFGGITTLKQYASVFPDVRFCPTGGITAENAKDYLALPNVICAGGTWLTPAETVASRDWSKITMIAKESLTHTR